MTSKKNTIRGWVVLVIILLAFSTIAFTIPFQKNAVFWVAYLFGIIAVVFQAYIFASSFSGKGDARSKFYGFPIARLGVYYLVVQLCISLIEIVAARFIPMWLVLLINILVLTLALLGCIAAETMRDEIVRQDKQLKKSVAQMRELQSLSAFIANQCNDEKLKKLLDKIAEDFRFSDPVTSENTAEMERDMLEQLKNIQQAIVDGEVNAAEKLSSELLGTLAERNRICSISK